MGGGATQDWQATVVLTQLSYARVANRTMSIQPQAFRAEQPCEQEYGAFYRKYLQLVPQGDILLTLSKQLEQFMTFLTHVPKGQRLQKHPPYTWSLHEVLGHLIDSERILGYRALCIARGEQQSLPGFDENAYVLSGQFDRMPWDQLAEEFDHLRRSHLCMFDGFDLVAWHRRGRANDYVISVRASAFILAGHVEHHLAIMKKRILI